MLILRPVRAEDADPLFPLVYRTPIADTLLWDGPNSLKEFRQNLAERASKVARGELHLFTMVDAASDQPLGSIDIRQENPGFRADIGLWVGAPYHGQGYGTQAVRWVTAYGFERLGLEKINSYVFVGNSASRRIFEKNGFLLEGTIRNADRKRGQPIDVWALGITHSDYLAAASPQDWIVHLCTRSEWAAALHRGYYLTRSLQEFGFIHCSRPEQILQVANAYFRSQPDIVAVWLYPRLLIAELRWEPVEAELFPHLYGPLNTNAAFAITPLVPTSDGYYRQIPPSPPFPGNSPNNVS